MAASALARWGIFVYASALAVCSASGAPIENQTSPYNAPRQFEPIPPEERAVSPLMAAVESVAAKSEDPARTRGTLLQRIRYSNTCYPQNVSQQDFETMLATTKLLPPALGQDGLRFKVDPQSWVGEAGIGTAGSGSRAHLTYSFVADGTSWGNSCSTINVIQASNLGSKLTTRFGSLDAGREYIRSALAAWKRCVGVTYTEVTDDGVPMDLNNSPRVSTRGDIRIGGISWGSLNVAPLAYNAFPATGMGSVSGCSGGDMVINTLYFASGWFNGAAGDALLFRNVVAHEHGHGLGLIHSVPCNLQKLMEPQVSDLRVLLGYDDMRGGQRNYGDRFSGNHTYATARDLGNLTNPVLRSVIERDLSINGSRVPSTDDFFVFTLGSTQQVTITATPTGNACAAGTTCTSDYSGASCCTGQQTSGCTGNYAPVDAIKAGNPSVTLFNAGYTALAFSSVAPAGSPEIVGPISLGAGTYYIRVSDATGQGSADSNLQLYDLTVRIPNTYAAPQVIAGLDKLATANTVTKFIGDHNSIATEAGATLPPSNYEWDLDGDGEFETTAALQATKTYVSNGVYPVTLRITDSNGRVGTDTISVTVRGATTLVSSISPSSMGTGTSGPVVITGKNFKGVTGLCPSGTTCQIVVSGTGVTVSGTPVVNAMGTQITGLTFTVAGGGSPAPLGLRNITVNNSDGLGATGTGTGKLTIAAPAANDECAAAISWGSALGNRPFSTIGASTSPNQNCSVIYGDTWYSWTAPATGTLTTTTDAGFVMYVAAYTGLSCPNGSTVPAACSTSGAGDLSFPVVVGQSYLFRIGAGPNGGAGSANLILSLSTAAGACCATDGSCTSVVSSSCSGAFQGAGVACNPCPQPTVRCCFANGSCQDLTTVACSNAGGASGPTGSTCASGACAQPNVRCCFADGSCQDLTSAACNTMGGTPGAYPSACSSGQCPQPTGVCCRGATCAITTSADCTAPGGITPQFQSQSSVCNAGGNASQPCCLCDFDKSGTSTVDDVFVFLNAWFASSVYANISGNGAGAPTIDDIFIFLNAWFAGCG